jgi:hypothetical protein
LWSCVNTTIKHTLDLISDKCCILVTPEKVAWHSPFTGKSLKTARCMFIKTSFHKGYIGLEIYFSNRTLALALFAIYFTLSICMFHYLHSRKTYSGFTAWVAGVSCLTVASLLLGLRGVIPDIFTVIVANGVGAISFFLIYYGLKSFVQEKVNLPLHIAVLTLYSLFIFPLLTYTLVNLNLRISLVSFVSGIYLFLCATTLVQSARRRKVQLNQFLLITLLLLVVVRFSRGIYFLFPLHNVNEYMAAGPFLGVMTLLTAILSISLVIGMMQVNTERLEGEHLATINDLRTALDEIKTLRGILPICSYCNNIRDENGHWNSLESYIAKYSEAEFSHGICQECAAKHYPDMNLYDG